MSLPRVMLCGGLLTGLLAAPPAEARFGKRSDASETSKPVHEASAIGAEDSDDPENRNPSASAPTTVSSTDDCCGARASDDLAAALLGVVFEVLFRGMGEAIASTGTHRNVQPEPDAPPPLPDTQRHAVPFSFRLGLLAAPFDRGAGMDFALGWDFHRFGADFRLDRLGVTAGNDDFERLHTLSQLHLTYSPVVHEALRLRVEAGVSTADVPRGLYVAPSVGMSAEACVAGPLDVEARFQLTPFPYQQMDARAGLALHLGSFMLRGGLRGLYLDRELGVRTTDWFFGPEFGLGFVF